MHSRSSGSRLGKYLKEYLPLILEFVKSDEDVESEEDEELRENCLQVGPMKSLYFLLWEINYCNEKLI